MGAVPVGYCCIVIHESPVGIQQGCVVVGQSCIRIDESSIPVGYCCIVIDVGAIGIDDGSVLIRDRSVVVYYLACVVVGGIIQNGNDEGLFDACVVFVGGLDANGS